MTGVFFSPCHVRLFKFLEVRFLRCGDAQGSCCSYCGRDFLWSRGGLALLFHLSLILIQKHLANAKRQAQCGSRSSPRRIRSATSGPGSHPSSAENPESEAMAQSSGSLKLLHTNHHARKTKCCRCIFCLTQM